MGGVMAAANVTPIAAKGIIMTGREVDITATSGDARKGAATTGTAMTLSDETGAEAGTGTEKDTGTGTGTGTGTVTGMGTEAALTASEARETGSVSEAAAVTDPGEFQRTRSGGSGRRCQRSIGNLAAWKSPVARVRVQAGISLTIINPRLH